MFCLMSRMGFVMRHTDFMLAVDANCYPDTQLIDECSLKLWMHSRSHDLLSMLSCVHLDAYLSCL